MSPIRDFEDEVFISYAHIDNQPLDEGLKGWVETLHERLQIRLTQLTGEPVAVWRDRKLQGNDIFAETLVARLSKVALLVAVVSPRYVKSEWCLKELEEFCRCAARSGGLTVGDKCRVFKVVKIHIPLESHPPQLRGVLGYEFYEYDAERGRAKEFNPEVVPQRDIRYWEKLDDLAYDIKHLVETIRHSDDEAAHATAAVGASAPAGKTVYLAETVSELRGERDLIKRELQQRGHVVLPDVELPLRGGALKEAVRDCLRRSELSVHLVGGYYGIIPEEESRSLVEIQCELADEMGGDLRRIVWMPVGLEPRDERQRQFIENFHVNLNGHRRTEVLQTSLEDLKKLLEERTSVRAAPEPEPAARPAEEEASNVYLICDKEDLAEVTPVADYLYESGFDVVLPAFEGDEAQIRDDHKANLLECDAVMLYFGRGSEIWLRMKQRELQKIAGYGRTKPMLAKAVYLAPPHTPAKEQVRDRESVVVKNFGPFSPDALAPFVERIRKAKGGQR